MTMVRHAFFITPEHAAGLKALKERDGTPESETIRRALTEYLQRKGAQQAAAPGRRRGPVAPPETKKARSR
jgi:hypothetical protein